jgi:hypothetical protein
MSASEEPFLLCVYCVKAGACQDILAYCSECGNEDMPFCVKHECPAR